MPDPSLLLQSLEGLTIGDQFGETFFLDGEEADLIAARALPERDWVLTDDTVMAIGICEVLLKRGSIEQDDLARVFAANHARDELRGYGAATRTILRGIEAGRSWRELSPEAFEGMGSMGNGAAMRVAPLGAYFHEDVERVKAEAERSAEVTHHHPEGRAGAIAVAVAAALAARQSREPQPAEAFTGMIAEHVPASQTRQDIVKTLQFSKATDVRTVTAAVGNGEKISAPDTVPFVVWCAAHHLDNFEEALWTAVSALGDRDTICAMVGGIVSLSAPGTIPPEWRSRMERPEHSQFWMSNLRR